MTSTSTDRRTGLATSLPGTWLARYRARPGVAVAPGTSSAGTAPVTGIRPRRPKDVPACVRLMRVVFHADQYPEQWPEAPRAWLDDVQDAWVSERQGQILGHIAVGSVGEHDRLSAARWAEVTGHHPSRLAGVSRLFVRPSARGQGIGTGLLDVAAERIAAQELLPVVEVVSARRDGVPILKDRGWQLVAMDPRDRSGRQQVYRYAARRS